MAGWRTDASGQVVGFASCNWFNPRPAYRFSAEDSIYVADAVRHQGIGSKLLAALLRKAENAGVRKMIAVIGDPAKTGSVSVHQAQGFEHVGVLKNCGWKFNRWLDVVMMDKVLGQAWDFLPLPLTIPLGSSQTVLHCARRTSTALSCAFREQEGWSGCSRDLLTSPRIPSNLRRRQSSLSSWRGLSGCRLVRWP